MKTENHFKSVQQGQSRSRTMQSPASPDAPRYGLCATALALLLGIAACSPSSPAPVAPSATPEQRHFAGTGSIAGTRQALDLGPDHRAEVFRLTGSLMLSGQARPSLAFKSEIIGFSDSRTGMYGRSAWTDEHGEQVFSDLRSNNGSRQFIEGRFVGGTGRYAGVSGEYSFQWQPLVGTEDGGVSGRIVGLKGWAQLAPTGAGQPAAGSPP